MLKMKKIIIGSILAAVLTAAILSVLTLIMLRIGLLSGQLSGTLSAIGSGIAVLTAAVVTARWAGERGLLHGTVVAAVYSVLYIALTYLQCTGIVLLTLFVRVLLFVLCGAVGGIIGVSINKKVRF